ncbi:DUF4174 domain-containing protein [Phaeobacter sp. BS52]|uniref:DUF4174 domain-containing protein n=1 Tax=Phaeobacter sp. BS52 TaxID=2907241 RepID=UPI0038679EC3
MKHLFVFGKNRFGLAEPRIGSAGILGLVALLAMGPPSAGVAQQAAAAAAEDTGLITEETTSPGASDAEALVEVADPPADPLVQLVRPGASVELDDLMWLHRPIVVFADSPADPRFHEQMERLTDGAEALLDRDVVVLTDTDPSVKSALRKKLRPRGFMLVLIGKDGGVKLRKPQPWTVRELSRTIDKFPSRLREVEERRGS